MHDVALGPYLLHEPIGRGASGVVWRAVHASQGLAVAVKVLHATRERAATFEDALRSEVETVAALSHPGIVLLFDQGEVNAATARASHGALLPGQPYLAMELCSGGSLAELGPDFRWREVDATVHALLDALAHAHARGVVHRDLKPSNVLLAGPEDLRPGLKLTDFGVAWSLQDRRTRSVTGTPRYMAPEQFRGDPRDLGPWTDLYALACMIWELCTDDTPFGDGEPPELGRRHLYEQPGAFSPRFGVPDELEGWLRRLLAKDITHRYRRAADALAGFDAMGVARRGAVSRPSTPRRRVALTIDTLDDLLAAQGVDDPDRTLSDIVPLDVVPSGEPDSRPLAALLQARMPLDWRRPATPEPPHLVGAGLGLYDLRVAPVVGRADLQDALWDHLAAVEFGDGPRVVVLEGPSGVGKSALARWLCERSHETGAALPLVVHHELAGSGQGLRATTARAFGIDGLPRAAAAQRLAHYLGRRGEPDATEAQALAAMLVPDDDSTSRHQSDVRERDALLTRLLLLEGQHRPVVLWLDDVQWGEASLGFVAAALESAQPLRALFVLTVQDEALAEHRSARELLDDIRDRPQTYALPVGPLSHDDTVTLIQRLLPLEDELAAELAERVGGNPLFAFQVLGEWVQRDALVPCQGRYVLRSDHALALPDDLHGIWSARIDRLLLRRSPGARPALEIAAALGASVDDAEWVDACERAGAGVPPRLVGKLVRARLAVPSRSSWRFAHGMLRESIARSAREAGRWQAANRACAAMLATRPGAAALARRGRHLLEAGEPASALDALLEAAGRQLQRDDARVASVALDLAQEAMDQLAALPPPDLERRRARWWLLRAHVHTDRQDLDRGAELARRAEEAARAQGWDDLLADALAEAAQIARVRGDLRASRARFEEALQAYEALGDNAKVADTLRSLAHVASHLGLLDLAALHLHEARRHDEQLGDQIGAALATVGLGEIARLRADWSEASNAFRSALAILRTAGHRAGVASALHGLAEVHRLTGHIDDAERGYQEVLRLEESLGRDTTVSRLNLALCRLALHDHPGALRILEGLEATWSMASRPGYLAVAHVAALVPTAAQGQWSTWHRHLAEAEQLLAASAFVDVDIARLARIAGGHAQAAGRPAEAERAWRIARAQWLALGSPDEVAAVDVDLAALVPGR